MQLAKIANTGRRVTEICEIVNYEGGRFKLNPIYRFTDGKLVKTSNDLVNTEKMKLNGYYDKYLRWQEASRDEMTPFTMKDVDALGDGLTILTNYMSFFQIAAMVAVIVLVIAAFVVLFIKGPKVRREISVKKNLVVIILVISAAC